MRMLKFSCVTSICVIGCLYCCGLRAEEPHTADDSPVQQLIDQLGAADFDAREQARTELLTRAEAFYLQYTKALNHSDPEVRRGIQQVLTQLKERLLLVNLMGPLDEQYHPLIDEAIMGLDEKIRIELLSSNPEKRARQIRVLSNWCAQPHQVPILLAFSFDESADVRAAVAALMGEFKHDDVYQRLLVLAQEEDEQLPEADPNAFLYIHDLNQTSVAGNAFISIGMMQTQEAAEFLVQQLKSPRAADHQEHLVTAMGHVEQPRIVLPALMQIFNSLQTESSRGTSSFTVNNKTVTIQSPTAKDQALIAIVDVSGQDLEAYGLDKFAPGGAAFGRGVAIRGRMGLNGYQDTGFTSDEAREKGYAKLVNWYEQWSRTQQQTTPAQEPTAVIIP